MGKKSKRRPASKSNKKKGQQQKSGSPTAAADAAFFSKIELLNQSQLISAGRHYYGEGMNWAHYDESLLGYGEGELYEVEVNEEDGGLAGNVANLKLDNEAAAKKYEKGSVDALKAAINDLWSDKTISDPHGIGLAMGPKEDWMEWALDVANLPDRVEIYFKELEKDKDMHKTTLKKLSLEKQGGYNGSLDYILALNCILQDTFVRLGFDPPPALNLYQALSMRIEEGEPLFKMRMQVWKGYEKLAFEVVKTVQRNPIIPKPDPPSMGYYDEIDTLKNRGEFPTSVSRCQEEESEDGGIFGGACGFSGAEVEELMAQGVRPWDDDAHNVLAALNGYYD